MFEAITVGHLSSMPRHSPALHASRGIEWTYRCTVSTLASQHQVNNAGAM